MSFVSIREIRGDESSVWEHNQFGATELNVCLLVNFGQPGKLQYERVVR